MQGTFRLIKKWLWVFSHEYFEKINGIINWKKNSDWM